MSQSFLSHSGGSFHISGNTMNLGIFIHQKTLSDLAPDSWNFQNASSFKQHSGCFYHVPKLKCYLISICSPLHLLLWMGSFKEKFSKGGARGPTRHLIKTHNEVTVYLEILCAFTEVGPGLHTSSQISLKYCTKILELFIVNKKKVLAVKLFCFCSSSLRLKG